MQKPWKTKEKREVERLGPLGEPWVPPPAALEPLGEPWGAAGSPCGIGPIGSRCSSRKSLAMNKLGPAVVRKHFREVAAKCPENKQKKQRNH